MRLVIQTNIPGGHDLWTVNKRGIVVDESHPRHQHHGADRLLKEIHTLIGRKRLTEILVVRGPGPFTAIRAALVIANMLGWLRTIPVTGLVRKNLLTDVDLQRSSGKKKFDRPVRPWYGRRPNITVAKKRM